MNAISSNRLMRKQYIWLAKLLYKLGFGGGANRSKKHGNKGKKSPASAATKPRIYSNLKAAPRVAAWVSHCESKMRVYSATHNFKYAELQAGLEYAIVKSMLTKEEKRSKKKEENKSSEGTKAKKKTKKARRGDQSDSSTEVGTAEATTRSKRHRTEVFKKKKKIAPKSEATSDAAHDTELRRLGSGDESSNRVHASVRQTETSGGITNHGFTHQEDPPTFESSTALIQLSHSSTTTFFIPLNPIKHRHRIQNKFSQLFVPSYSRQYHSFLQSSRDEPKKSKKWRKVALGVTMAAGLFAFTALLSGASLGLGFAMFVVLGSVVMGLYIVFCQIRRISGQTDDDSSAEAAPLIDDGNGPSEDYEPDDDGDEGEDDRL